MSHKGASYFDSIESAHEFLTLLAETIVETRRDIEADTQRELTAQFPRRAEALQIVLYSLEKLELHLSKSRRILNDLRALRRILLTERTAVVPTNPSKSFRKVKTAPRVALLPSSPTSPAGRRGARRWWERDRTGVAA